MKTLSSTLVAVLVGFLKRARLTHFLDSEVKLVLT